jgi:hypothetical protein
MNTMDIVMLSLVIVLCFIALLLSAIEFYEKNESDGIIVTVVALSVLCVGVLYGFLRALL